MSTSARNVINHYPIEPSEATHHSFNVTARDLQDFLIFFQHPKLVYCAVYPIEESRVCMLRLWRNYGKCLSRRGTFVVLSWSSCLYPQQIREMAQENQPQKLKQWMVIKTTFHPKLRTWMKLVKESADEKGITPTYSTVLTASRKSLLLIHALSLLYHRHLRCVIFKI